MASPSSANSNARMVYLITYSRAKTERCPSREQFAQFVLEGWQFFQIPVSNWAVCLEAHADANVSAINDVRNDYHFHMAIKLSKRARWLQVRNFLDVRYGIKVHFSDSHDTYYSAYRYVTKEDAQFLLSPNHPDLSAPPSTAKAISCKRRRSKDRSPYVKRGRKEKRLSIFDVTKVVQSKQISSRLELVCLAVQQQREGKTGLAEFIANRGNKAVDEAICLAKEFSQAEVLHSRLQKTRWEILEEQCKVQCVEGCNGQWLTAAVKLVESHEILLSAFCNAICHALKEGRGKYRNIFIYGPANSGKTFILAPLKKIYHTFCNPATGSFAWMGVEDAEIILLNDFRWNPAIIAWADFLQALEGDIVHLPAPKNFCKRDIEFTKDTPFFATSDAPIALVKGGSIDRVNTEMMEVRWRYFHFWKQIPLSEQEHIVPCGHCFSQLIIENMSLQNA